MSITLAQQKALAIAPKIPAFLSLLGSSFVCYEVLKSRKNLSSSSQRLILGMSVCDSMASSWWFMTTWPIPAGTPNTYGAVGNTATCTVQGFFTQFSVSTVLYNASLSFYYVFKIRYSWSDAKVQKVEPYFHIVSAGFGLATALAGIPLTLFNSVGWDCWIGSYPMGCKESWRNGGVTTCERGDNAEIYQWAFFYAPLWLVILVVTVLMVSVYRAVLEREKAMDKFRHDVDLEERRKLSRQMAVHALRYAGAFYITWIFPTIFELTIILTHKVHYGLQLTTAIFVPGQGFLNVFIYSAPKFTAFRKAHADLSFMTSVKKFMVKELNCCQEENAEHI